MPYLIGPNSAEMTPNMNSATISTGIEESAMPTTATAAVTISTSFKLAGDRRLVETVGQFAAKRRKQQEGGHEDGARQRDQRCRLVRGEREEDEEDQRVLQEIVVEGRQELRPEQRRKTPGCHQMGCHGDFQWSDD